MEKSIRHTCIRNACNLIDKGHGNDQYYSGKVIAVVLIMKNPHLLN